MSAWFWALALVCHCVLDVYVWFWLGTSVFNTINFIPPASSPGSANALDPSWHFPTIPPQNRGPWPWAPPLRPCEVDECLEGDISVSGRLEVLIASVSTEFIGLLVGRSPSLCCSKSLPASMVSLVPILPSGWGQMGLWVANVWSHYSIVISPSMAMILFLLDKS